jgi:hypothetical protein
MRLGPAWERAKAALKANRRRAAAFAGAALINALAVGAFLVSIHPQDLPQDRAITVWLAPPFAIKHKASAAKKTPTSAPRLHTPPRVAEPPPTVIAPPPLPPPPPAKWTPQPDVRSRLDDQPSVQRDLRAGAACAKGELWKLSRAEQDRCLARWGKVNRPNPDQVWRREPPPDPSGEFTRAAEAAEERRRPMQKAPLHDCDKDGTTKSNLPFACHD